MLYVLMLTLRNSHQMLNYHFQDLLKNINNKRCSLTGVNFINEIKVH